MLAHASPQLRSGMTYLSRQINQGDENSDGTQEFGQCTNGVPIQLPTLDTECCSSAEHDAAYESSSQFAWCLEPSGARTSSNFMQSTSNRRHRLADATHERYRERRPPITTSFAASTPTVSADDILASIVETLLDRLVAFEMTEDARDRLLQGEVRRIQPMSDPRRLVA